MQASWESTTWKRQGGKRWATCQWQFHGITEVGRDILRVFYPTISLEQGPLRTGCPGPWQVLNYPHAQTFQNCPGILFPCLITSKQISCLQVEFIVFQILLAASHSEKSGSFSFLPSLSSYERDTLSHLTWVREQLFWSTTKWKLLKSLTTYSLNGSYLLQFSITVHRSMI